MNEQIKLLAEQAEFSENDLRIQGDNFQKFAELIVQECLDCVDDLVEPDPYDEAIEGIYRAHNRALKQAINRIADRFGVDL